MHNFLYDSMDEPYRQHLNNRHAVHCVSLSRECDYDLRLYSICLDIWHIHCWQTHHVLYTTKQIGTNQNWISAYRPHTHDEQHSHKCCTGNAARTMSEIFEWWFALHFPIKKNCINQSKHIFLLQLFSLSLFHPFPFTRHPSNLIPVMLKNVARLI